MAVILVGNTARVGFFRDAPCNRMAMAWKNLYNILIYFVFLAFRRLAAVFGLMGNGISSFLSTQERRMPAQNKKTAFYSVGFS
jgi:hypothetical protein